MREPFDGCLRATLGDARHVIDAIADQREVVDDAPGRDAELGAHAGFVERFVAHGVNQRNERGNELRQILVAGRNDDMDALRFGLPGQGTDHVVGFYSFDHQDRPAGGGNPLMNRLDLPHHVFGHRRAVGLVVRVPVVAKGSALGVEDAGLVGDVVCLVVAIEPA